jgi:chromosome segregation ATPase
MDSNNDNSSDAHLAAIARQLDAVHRFDTAMKEVERLKQAEESAKARLSALEKRIDDLLAKLSEFKQDGS